MRKALAWFLVLAMQICAPLLHAQVVERCGYKALLEHLTPEQRRYIPGGDVYEGQFANARTGALCDSGTIFRIPVVFHIIHNGEPEGQGYNIPDARMHEQIRILNEDFRRKRNTPGFNTDPRGEDAMIEFYLAGEDPQGRASTGIVRVRNNQASWSVSDNDAIKATSVWPTNRYLNIWVCNLQGFLGYGSFPVTNLPLGGGAVYSRPDGVVVGYKYVGNSTQSRLYAGGRTITHELGHFLGLIHIWGDGDCSATDYCADTPPQNEALNRCPFIASDTAGIRCQGQPAIMYRNYMGYVYDSCMNIFTHDQVYRMRYVLCNTPARDSLTRPLTSATGHVEPKLPLVLVKTTVNSRNEFNLQFNDSGPASIELIAMDGKYLGKWDVVASAQEDLVLNLNFLGSGLYALFVSQKGRREMTRIAVGTSYSK